MVLTEYEHLMEFLTLSLNIDKTIMLRYSILKLILDYYNGHYKTYKLTAVNEQLRVFYKVHTRIMFQPF